MPHTTSNEPLNELLDETMAGSVQPKRSPTPRLSQKGWGLLLGSALLLAGGTWGIVQITRSTHSPEAISAPAIAVEALSIQAQLLLKIENPDRLQLEISVPEENLRFVRVSQPVQVRVEAASQTLNATIQQIIPAADPNSRSFLVKVPLNNSGRLISGANGR